jgi:glycosyltransferase involved in cell wall biosynthesis
MSVDSCRFDAVHVRMHIDDRRRRSGQSRGFRGIIKAEPIGRLQCRTLLIRPRGGHRAMIDRHHNARVALAHDWLVGLRGGEWVLDRLARLYGPTTLYTLVDDRRPLTDAISACRTVTSPLQRMPFASGRLRRHYLPLMPWAVERLRVTDCDLLISTSSAVMKSIRPPAGVPHLCYCHSPARYIWDQSSEYALGAGGRLRSAGLRAFRHRFMRWDRRTASRVTRFLANSQHTADRIARCYGRDAAIVHPPVRTDFFTPDPGVEREDWLLVVAALEPYKRTDIVIEAANRVELPLKVVGGGSQSEAIRRTAGKTVEVLGRVGDEALRDLYRRARALVFPQIEDFGIVPVEAQATGCPVVAFARGGALETVSEQTGVFFDEQTPQSILGAIDELMRAPIEPAACRENALRFSEAAFDAAIVKHVEGLLASSDR